MNDIRYPFNWQQVSLGDVCYINKYTLSEKTSKEYKFKYIDLSSVDKGNIVFPNQHIFFKDAPCRARRIIHQNDIIMSTVRPNLQGFALIDFNAVDFICSTGFAVLTTKENVSNKYIYQLLYSKEIENQINNMLVGSNYPAINGSDVASLKLLLPPLTEQKKIADILGTWDEAIEKLSNLIEQKKLLKKGLMQKLLTGKTRLSGFTQPWKEVKLGEMGHITSAGVDKNIVPGEQNVILLNYMDIYKKDFIYKDDIKQIVTAPDRKIKKCNVLMGDVFFTPSSETRDDIGHSAVIMENIPGAVYSYHIVRFRPLLNHLNRKFCAYAFKTSKFYKQAYSLCEGSGQRYVLSQDDFRNMKVYIPSDISEQQAIADVLSTADDEINLLNQKLEALKEQKKGLMQQLLTGQIRVKVN